MSRPNLTFFQRVDRLHSLPARLRVAALADALLGCSGEEVEALAPALLELAVVPMFEGRGAAVPWISRIHRLLHRAAGTKNLSLSALRGVARAYARLSPEHRAAARAIGADRWHLVAPPLATDTLVTARRSLALLASDTGQPELLRLLPSLLHDPEAEVARQAEEGLVQAVTTPPDGASGSSDPLLEALAESVTSFSVHRRRGALVGVIEAFTRSTRHRAAGAGAPGAARLVEALSHANDDTIAALRTTLQSARSPASRLRAWEWLPNRALESACARRLGRAESIEDHEALLASSHLIAHPKRAAVWSLARPAPDLPGPAELGGLSAAARRGLPRLATAPVRPTLAALVADEDAVVRFAAARSLPPGLAHDFTFDPDPFVATSAAIRFFTGAGAEPIPAEASRTRRLLARSPHAGVRGVAGAWDVDSSAMSARRRLVERVAAVADPARWRARVVARLLGDDPARVLDAAVTVRALASAPAFAEELLGACRRLAGATPGGAEARALATILGALGATDRRDHAAGFLEHADPRVRANAVEALAPRGARLHPALIELKPDRHHRARANLLRGLLRHGAPGGARAPWDELLAMLADADPAHRLAGAWLVSRVARPPEPLRSAVGGLAARDNDPRVRRRAAHASARWGVPA